MLGVNYHIDRFVFVYEDLPFSIAVQFDYGQLYAFSVECGIISHAWTRAGQWQDFSWPSATKNPKSKRVLHDQTIRKTIDMWVQNSMGMDLEEYLHLTLDPSV